MLRKCFNKISNEHKENFDNILKAYQAAEKKIASLTKDIELKDMQLNSQSQMILRRNQEIHNLSTKLENTSTQSFHNISKTVSVDPEKEKLVKENLSLMNANYNLNTKLNKLADHNNRSRFDVN